MDEPTTVTTNKDNDLKYRQNLPELEKKKEISESKETPEGGLEYFTE